MPKTAEIVADLQTIENIANKPGVQTAPGFAYFGTSILLQPGNGYQYPIDEFIQSIHLQESIHQMGLFGYLEIADTYNLIRNGIILGQELLYFAFCTAGAEVAGLERDWLIDFYKHPLQVYKVEDLKELGTNEGGKAANTLTYRLHFCSPELLINDRVRVSKTIQGTYTDMISDMITNHLKSKKSLTSEDTDDLKRLIIPNLHHMEFINRILPNAQKEVPLIGSNPHSSVPSQPTVFKGRLTDFMFWETTRGYNFLPMIQPQADSKLTLTVGGVGDLGSAAYSLAMLESLSHEYIKHGNTYANIKMGGWGSKHIQHNAYSKSVKTYQSNYHRSLGLPQYSHVSATPVYKTNEFEKNRDGEDRMISDFPEGAINFNSFGGSQKNTTINKSNREVDTPWTPTPATTDMKRNIQMIHALSYDRLKVVINGISKLEAGMTVRLDLPDIGAGSGFFKETVGKWENRLDNVWIITDIRHTIQLPANNYRCELSLSNTMAHTALPLPVYEAPGTVPIHRAYT